MHKLTLHSIEAELLGVLVHHGVRFVVVGGYAVIFHGHLRAAKDLDLFVDQAGDNPARIVAALQSFRLTVPGFTAEWLAEGKRQLPIPRTIAELLTWIEGVDFAEAWDGAVPAQVNGLQVRVLSRNHLIRCKRAALLIRDDPQDRADLAALDRLSREQA